MEMAPSEHIYSLGFIYEGDRKYSSEGKGRFDFKNSG